MLYSYHQLFKFKSQLNDLVNYAKYYNHLYHYAYKLIIKQNINLFADYWTNNFPNYLIRTDKSNQINYNLLIKDYLNGKIKFPSFSYDLDSENKKQFLKNKQVTSRQFNSIRFQLKGNLSAIYQINLEDIEGYKFKINRFKENLTLLKNKIKFHIKTFNLSTTQITLIKKLYPYYISYINKHKNKYVKFNFENFINHDNLHYKIKNDLKNIPINQNACNQLFPLFNKCFTQQQQINRISQKLNSIILNLLQGKLPLCFGTKKLFNKQHNLNHYYKDYKSANHDKYFKLWKKEWEDVRNNSFYLVGARAEISGNQSCIARIQNNGLIELKIRKPDYLIQNKNKKGSLSNYIVLNDLDFKKYHNLLIGAINTKKAIHYRFERNINKSSPKYNAWTITFQIEAFSSPVTTNKKYGAIGLDLNQEHVSLAELNQHGNLLKSFDIYLNLYSIYKNKINDYSKNIHMRNHNKITDLTSNQSTFLIEQIAKEICSIAKEKLKPIIIEDLDFSYKKKSLSLDNTLNKEYKKKKNKQLNSFIYNKFKSALLSRAEKDGVEIIQVNPAYTSLLGLVNYQKIKGISVHQSAAFVIARKGLGFKERIPNIASDEILNNKKTIKFIYRGYVIESAVPVRKQITSGNNEITLLKDLSKNIQLAKSQFNEKLKQEIILKYDKKKNKFSV